MAKRVKYQVLSDSFSPDAATILVDVVYDAYADGPDLHLTGVATTIEVTIAAEGTMLNEFLAGVAAHAQATVRDVFDLPAAIIVAGDVIRPPWR